MAAQKTPLRWGIKRRMEFIEFRLLWEGKINRADLIDQFGVSVPQASTDLSQYRDAAPQNIVYDAKEKCYIAAPKFKPAFLEATPDRYLSQLRLIAEQLLPQNETWISSIPSLDTTPTPHRQVSVDILRTLVDAIRQNKSIETYYQSMNPKRPDPIWRWMTPHALFNDGLRWHVRSFCHVDQIFKDFLLSRFLEVRDLGKSSASPQEDTSWHEIIDVVLSPNPKLSKSQQKVIAQDYGMANHKISIPVRKAALYYFEKRLRLDMPDASANEVPVIIENRKAFDAALVQANKKNGKGNKQC